MEKFLKEEESNLLGLNLQFFGSDDEPEEGSEDDDESKKDDKKAGSGIEGALNEFIDDDGNVNVSIDELKRVFDSETDKKFDKAMNTYKKNLEKDIEEQIIEAKKEAERLAKLSEDEREEEERKKREAALEKREKELNMREIRAEAIGIMNEKKLPTEFVDMVVADDADTTHENINVFKTKFEEAVNQAVKEHVVQSTPSDVAGGSNGYKNPFSKEHWNLTEQGKLFTEDYDLYKKLQKEAKK